jgi:hypothetical protein
LVESLEAVRPEMVALGTNNLASITVDPIVAVGTARGAIPRILEYREPLSKLWEFKVVVLDRLHLYASAALHANMLYQAASEPPERFQHLVADATDLRELFVADTTALQKRELVDGSVLGELRGAVGYRNIASDLLTLVNLVRSNWPKIAGRTGITLEELERAESIGNQLVGDIGVREQSPTAVAAFALERQQTYTLLVNGYEEARRGLTYLRWYEDDVDRIAPSLFAGRRRKVTHEPEPPPEAVPATAKATATEGAAPVTAAAVKPGPGLPGADPFIH